MWSYWSHKLVAIGCIEIIRYTVLKDLGLLFTNLYGGIYEVICELVKIYKVHTELHGELRIVTIIYI